jgi:hypothetical protein
VKVVEALSRSTFHKFAHIFERQACLLHCW